MNSAVEILKAARELISDPAHWTQGSEARDEKGDPVLARSKGARCFCAVGALISASGKAPWKRPLEALRSELPKPIFYVSDFNDTGSHEEVLALFDRAIERAAS